MTRPVVMDAFYRRRRAADLETEKRRMMAEDEVEDQRMAMQTCLMDAGFDSNQVAGLFLYADMMQQLEGSEKYQRWFSLYMHLTKQEDEETKTIYYRIVEKPDALVKEAILKMAIEKRADAEPTIQLASPADLKVLEDGG